MFGINYWAIIVAAVAVFVVSTFWYIVFAKQRMKLSNAKFDPARPQPWKILAELTRSLILGFVIANLIEHSGVVSWTGAVQLGLLPWIGFPFILLTGSIMWENVPWKLAAIHAGD